MLAVVAVCEALALIVLMPLKTVVPYTLLVDRQTGFVQALKPLDPQLIAGDSALTQSFLVQYIIGREEFDRDTLQANYHKVTLWSGGRARSDYIASMQVSDPNSPLARYPRTSIVNVVVKSVTAIGTSVAMVRYDTRRQDVGAPVQAAQAWIAVVRYKFAGEPLSLADRFFNPLGFEVVSFRRSAEILTPPEVDAETTRAKPSPQAAPLPVRSTNGTMTSTSMPRR